MKTNRSVSGLSAVRTVCFILLLAATAFAAQPKATFATLVNFNGTNGADPYLMSLVQGADGNLYGTTHEGGTQGLGTVFKVTPTGTLTTLYNFCSQADCKDGQASAAGLVLGADGNFYGTTTGVGARGVGTVFEITPAGRFNSLHSFCFKQPVNEDCPDGAFPEGVVPQRIGLKEAVERTASFFGDTGG